ncbi:hypothetical protein ACO0RG_001699 [Hanseniaspora osmophila]|uniref:Glyoxylate reductase 1 n=1 Tax=Hanseniaspora osmophila TaxID=56408 RepID=A0A1E5RH91_9ASCO|nr:Glyoxylate reductase 1 [Hanseniaspora osmophila]
MSKPIVLRLGDIRYAQAAWKKFGQEYDVIAIDSTSGYTREKFLKELQDPASKLSKVSVITRTFPSVQQTGLFDKELCDALPSSVKAICHNGAGYDQIQVEHFLERGIQVSNVPELVNNSTADTHVFLLLGALRNFKKGMLQLDAGNWNKDCAPGYDPCEKGVVGVLGLGGIGRCVVQRLKAFGFTKFLYHNRHRLQDPELENGCEYVSFDELLAKSDVLSINIPLNAKTRHIINADAFAKMKNGVVVVNTARGAVIDEQELINNLKSGKVASCGLDVFEHEPNVNKQNNELLSLSNCFALPHQGTNSVHTIKIMEEFVVENAESYLTSGKVKTIVPEMKGKF